MRYKKKIFRIVISEIVFHKEEAAGEKTAQENGLGVFVKEVEGQTDKLSVQEEVIIGVRIEKEL